MGNHIFISYSWSDRAYVSALAERLEAAGLNPWMFEHDQLPSVHFLDQLMAAIVDARAVLVVLTPTSMASTAVTQEVLYAIEKGKPILPLLCEEGDGRVAFLLRPFHWVDARSEAFPVQAIGTALGLTLGVEFPAVRLKALIGSIDLVRPTEVTLDVPYHAWQKLLSDPDFEVQIGTLGTLPDRTLVISLDLPTISKRHAHLSARRDAEGQWHYLIYDTSRNGTWVNGQRVKQCCELCHEALIGLVGETILLEFSLSDRTTLDISPYLHSDHERSV
ncbi:MAG: TIR domain-containing protein [Oscillochloris sp.]|nr:TIR domain-containing protein [Oscillochloris sp.]